MPEALDDGAAVFGHAALTLWHWALRPKELATVQPQGRAASILSGSILWRHRHIVHAQRRHGARARSVARG